MKTSTGSATLSNKFIVPDFLQGGGEMGELMREHDWSTSTLGVPDEWPQSLRTVVRLMLSTGHPMYIWWGADCACLYNDAYRESIGPERHPGSLGLPARKVWEEIWPIIGPQIEHVLSGKGATWNVDHLVPITRNGRREEVYWTYSYSPIDDETSPNGIGGVLVVCSETTRQVQAARRLAFERDQMAQLFEQAPTFMALLRGAEHRFEIVNPSYMKLVGDRQVLGKPVAEALPEAVAQGYLELLDQVFSTGQAYRASGAKFAIQSAPPNASEERFLDFVYQPIFADDGKVNGIFVEGFDVTEKHLTQEALRVSQERLNEGLEAARMTAWDWSADTRATTFSHNASEIFGADPETLKNPLQLLIPEDLASLKSVVKGAIQAKAPYATTIRFVCPATNKTIWIEIYGKPHFGQNGELLTLNGIALDITSHKRAEENLKQAEENLLRASRQKDDFLAMLAHELRNPLAPISAAASLLMMPGLDLKKIRVTGDIVTRQVNHMAALLDDLLDASRVSRGLVQLKKSNVDIKAIISAAVEQVRPLMEQRKHKMQIRLPSGLAYVMGDEKRLVQVIVNVLTNAARYTPENGTVEMSLESNEDHIAIFIEDNGIGMPSDLVGKVFDMFVQGERSSDRNQGGLGIGLALVKSLIDLHGGDVFAKSGGVGLGSLFTIRLPRCLADGLARRQTFNPSTSGISLRRKVMVVDDNVDAANALAMVLETMGHEVYVENTSPSALKRSTAVKPDIFLLDIGIPDMDGNELAARLRAQPESREAVLVAISGYAQEQDRQYSAAAGFDYHFAKPVAIEKLVEITQMVRPT